MDWSWLLDNIIWMGASFAFFIITLIAYYYLQKNAMRIAFWMANKFVECQHYGEKIADKMRKVPVTELKKGKNKRKV